MILNDVPHEDISRFQYGILLVSNSSDTMVEIKETTSSVTLAYERMLTLLKQYISKKVKVTIHKTITKPIVLCGSDI